MKTIQIIDDAKTPTSEMMDKFKKSFKVYSYWNNEELDKNFPIPEKSTIRIFKATQESEDMKGKSWNDMSENREQMMTFREYIIFFKKFYEETGEYADTKGWTAFKDSLPGGWVACGYWDPVAGYRRVRFFWDDAGGVGARGGARLAISLESSTLIPSDLESRVTRIENWIRNYEEGMEELKSKLKPM